MGDLSRSGKERVVAITPETTPHKLYKSLPLNTATVHPCLFKNTLDQIEQYQPRVIIFDCEFEFEQGLRKLMELKELYPRIPVVFLSDVKSYDSVIRAYHAGARVFMGKPANLFELKNTIENLLSIQTNCKEARTPLSFAKSSDTELSRRMSSDKPASVVRAIRYIEDNLSNKITLEHLAREAGLSKYYFDRTFYRHIKVTPLRFAARIRMERAKMLLRTVDMNIFEVAQQVGYGTLTSFVRHFKDNTGMTPTGYRKSLKKKGVAPGHQ